MKKTFIFLMSLISSLLNAQCPSVTITPVSQTLTCNGPAATFTAIFSPTTNVSAAWYGAGNTLLNVSGTSPLVMSTSNPGTYTFIATNNTSSCSTTQTVAVASVTTVPTMTVNALSGNTLSCNNPCTALNITASSGPAPKTYSWTNVTTSVTVMPITGGYTVCTPGNYIAEYQDGYSCRISQTITILIDTLRPTPLASTNLPSNSFTLNCYNSSLIASAYSNPLLPASSYSWTIPGNLTIATSSLSINTTSVPVSPTTYTVLARGANGCVGKQKVLFFKDLTAPSVTVSPLTKTITCNGAPATFTASFSPSATATGLWYGATNAPITMPTGMGPVNLTANNPGTYSFTTTYLPTGCSTTQTVSVVSNTVVPTFSIISTSNYSLNCATPCIIVQINASPGPAPKSYSWTNTSTSVTATPITGTYTICTAGNYVATYQDGNLCRVSQTLNVVSNTVSPVVTASSSSSLICVGQSALLSANGASTYTWSTGSNNPSISVSPTVTTNYTVTGTSSGCNGATVITQNVSLCTNVAGISVQNNFMNVFPNPNNGEFMIKTNIDLDCIILNELGQVIKEFALSDSNDHQTPIANLNNGIYFVIGQNNSQSIKQKIVVAK